MVVVNLFRTHVPGGPTLGTLVVVNTNDWSYHEFKTLELPWLGNERNISCIPDGVYSVSRCYSEKFGNCYRVEGVKDRTGILIHVGNYLSDTRGCILLGKNFSVAASAGSIVLERSAKAMLRALAVLPNYFKLVIHSDLKSYQNG